MEPVGDIVDRVAAAARELERNRCLGDHAYNLHVDPESLAMIADVLEDMNQSIADEREGVAA